MCAYFIGDASAAAAAAAPLTSPVSRGNGRAAKYLIITIDANVETGA